MVWNLGRGGAQGGGRIIAALDFVRWRGQPKVAFWARHHRFRGDCFFLGFTCFTAKSDAANKSAAGGAKGKRWTDMRE